MDVRVGLTPTECRRIDAFELWCWRRLLRVPWTARRSNQSILKEVSPEYSLEGLMLKLKFQSFGHLMRRADSLKKTLLLGKTEGRRRRGRQRMRWMASPTQWTCVRASSGRWWRTGKSGTLQCMESQKSQTLLSDSTTTKWYHVQTWIILLLPFQPRCLLFPFLPLTRTSSTMLKGSGKSGHFGFVPNLREKAS